MQRRCIALLIAAVFAAALFGCGKTAETNKTESREGLSVVTTLFYQYDFARTILGEQGTATLLLRPGQESHSYEPTPADVIKIQNADVFIYNGGVAETWVEKVLEGIDTDEVKVICMMDCIDVVEEEIVEGMENDHEHEEDHDHEAEDHDHEEHEGGSEYDEHIWTSPVNAQKLVSFIAAAIGEADAKHQDDYNARSEEYIAELKELDARFREVVAGAKRKTLVFGDRFPLRYFVEEYGLSYYAAFPGCSTETEPGAGTIAFLTNEIQDEGIPVVYYLELSNEKIADTLCENTGAEKLEFHSCHNVTQEEIDSGATYLSLMEGNVINLEKGLE